MQLARKRTRVVMDHAVYDRDAGALGAVFSGPGHILRQQVIYVVAVVDGVEFFRIAAEVVGHDVDIHDPAADCGAQDPIVLCLRGLGK